MKKKEVTTIVLETITALAGVVYLALQLYYGFSYQLPPARFLPNVLVVVVIYLALTWLSTCPEVINHLPKAECTGKVRVWSLMMIRLEKLIFLGSLLIPCAADALGVEIRSAWSAPVILLIIAIALYYEARILSELKNRSEKGE